MLLNINAVLIFTIAAQIWLDVFCFPVTGTFFQLLLNCKGKQYYMHSYLLLLFFLNNELTVNVYFGFYVINLTLSSVISFASDFCSSLWLLTCNSHSSPRCEGQ
jgi:hypothetical protein